MRKTKIVCTLGPAVDGSEKIAQLIDAGMNVARFNFSHGSYEDHLKKFNDVDKIRKEKNLPIGTMLDTKGPEIRLTTFENDKITLLAGNTFTLTNDISVIGNEERAAITYDGLWEDISIGQRILIDDGLIELKAIEIKDGDIVCTVVNGGNVSNRKSVNVPGISLSLPYISDKDYNDIKFGIETGFDFIAASFARTAQDILDIRHILDEHKCKTIKIIAKIENAQGVENIDEIIHVSDGIMVARGDMGVEIPFEEVPIIQKMIIKKAYGAGKHVITATQMLDSMMKNPRPTRAEATDVANAIYDGTSAIMLSGETAAGKYPLESVITMATIASRTEQAINYKKRYFSPNYDINKSRDVTYAISHATCTTAYDVNAAAIVTVTESGYTARMCSRFRVGIPIVACTSSISTFYHLSMSWGVVPLMIEEKNDYESLFASAIAAAKEAELCRDSDLLVLTAGVPIGITGTTNLLKVQMVGDVLVSGTPIAGESVIGKLCICQTAEDVSKKFNSGDILVLPRTQDSLIPIIMRASGLVVEEGGAYSHAANFGKTLNIPVIVGANKATQILKNGTTAKLDAKKGIVSNISTPIKNKGAN